MQHASLTDLNSALVEVLIRSTINVHYNFELLQCQPTYEILQEGVLYLYKLRTIVIFLASLCDYQV